MRVSLVAVAVAAAEIVIEVELLTVLTVAPAGIPDPEIVAPTVTNAVSSNVTVAEVFAEAIQRVFAGESVSALFEF